ncbi:aspartate/glutamate racemase family protein [Halomonas sp. Bachu 37]|uniref:aspartate/glutamate racemase family protein n=1 Tax=Halomonas kashgarensis TaxID=3084920 RepID=UPI0032162A55
MKTIGILGGMSWESTQSYYRALNLGVKEALGGLHSARVVLVSVDFAEIETLQQQGDWQAAGDSLASAARQVERAGADFLLIATNTMHKVAAQIEAAIDIPLLHIADATAERLLADGITKVGLLGTAFTMEQAFYKDRLSEEFGIEVLVPDAEQRKLVHRVIYEELCQGVVEEASRKAYLEVIDSLHGHGAQAVILGCTEIALLVEQGDTSVPLYDTTAIHCAAAVASALEIDP